MKIGTKVYFQDYIGLLKYGNYHTKVGNTIFLKDVTVYLSPIHFLYLYPEYRMEEDNKIMSRSTFFRRLKKCKENFERNVKLQEELAKNEKKSTNL